MADDAAKQLHEALQKRNKLMRCCGVFHLLSTLWLEPDVALGDRAKIVEELKFLVEKQRDEWQKFPRAIALPREDVGADGKSKEEFILCITAQLNVHIAGSSPTLTLAQDTFKKSTTNVRALLYLGEPLPGRKKKAER